MVSRKVGGWGDDTIPSIWYTCVSHCTSTSALSQIRLLLHHKGCRVSTISIRKMLDHCEASLNEQCAAGIMFCHVSILRCSDLILSLYSPPDQSKVESPSELLPTPKTKLTFSPPPEETEGESFAKKIVSEILGRSVERFQDSLIEGETTQDDDESKVEPSEEAKGEMNKSPHDNYVNYDIAQTVLESTAQRKSPSPAAGTYAHVNNLHR